MRIPDQRASRSLASKRVARTVLLFACALSGACASSGGTSSTGAAAPPVVPRNAGFDGGTQVRGGFTNVVSSVQDSVISRPPAAVWPVMARVFETLGIETPTVDPRSYVIGNPGSRVARISGSTRLSSYLDCGMGVLGPNADRYEVTLQLMVQLAAYPIGATLVRTTLDAYARPRDSSGDPIHCSSQRTLERQVIELIGVELAGGGAPRAGSGLTAQGRIPMAGDVLRVECAAPEAQSRPIGQGVFLGEAEGELLLEMGAGGGIVLVPVTHVGRVQVRERRSAAKLVGFVGAGLGALGGGYYGRSRYDPEGDTHYPQGVFTTAGGFLGGVAGVVVGRIIGSFIGTDAWLDAPSSWAGRYSVSTEPVEAAAGAAVCASFASGD